LSQAISTRKQRGVYAIESRGWAGNNKGVNRGGNVISEVRVDTQKWAKVPLQGDAVDISNIFHIIGVFLK